MKLTIGNKTIGIHIPTALQKGKKKLLEELLQAHPDINSEQLSESLDNAIYPAKKENDKKKGQE